VSFSFDDAPRSALIAGGEILHRHGFVGTYYISGIFAGAVENGLTYFKADDLHTMVEAGHEIGCHTFDHLHLPSKSRTQIEESLALNNKFVRDVLGDYALASFAYPFGAASPASKRLLGRAFAVCRGTWPGVNHGGIDFGQLRAVPLEHNSIGRIDIEGFLDQAVAHNGWLVFFTHDISNQPSPFGYPTSAFAEVVASVARRRLEVMTVRDAGRCARSGSRLLGSEQEATTA
jgi:peptidoglycan/xylan/chitin deacetylase (PgdA/CDA1 family)